MSMHKEVKSKQEVEGLLLHGMPVGKPSQLSDAFVLGMRYERKEDVSAYPVSDEDFGYYAALAMPFFSGDEKDLHEDLVAKGWSAQQATDFLDRMRTLYHKHTNEMLPFIRTLTEDKLPEKERVEFSCTVTWLETVLGRKHLEVFVPNHSEDEYGDMLRTRLAVSECDLVRAIQQSGQTLIPADTHYGMVLEYVNKERPVLVGWRLAYMGKGGNTILAVSQ